MEKIESNKSLCSCGSNEYITEFNPFSIIEVDTILISSRHLFRMPYSLHEKSGLISLPFNPDKVLKFQKKFASPKIAKVSPHIFIDRENAIKGEALFLLEKAMDYAKKKEIREESNKKKSYSDNFEALEQAIPEVLFPPCIEKLLKGLEDGKKRAIFIIINFLKCVGWNYDQIDARLKEWNKVNPEPLREQLLLGQLRYHQRNKENILPPNCDNKMYYKDMQVCIPDNFCNKIKNPVNYSIIKSKLSNKTKKKKKKAVNKN
jgi:hypothetical protein